MNRWAINVTAINEAETHLGSGTAPAVLATSGDGFSIRMLNPAQADMALDTEGVALLKRFGFASGALSMSVVGRAILVIRGYADADAALLVDGEGRIVPGTGGQAEMELYADGFGRLAMRGDGIAPMVLVVDHAGRSLATRGVAQAAMDLSARYGIPVLPVHPGFLDSVPARRLGIDDDDRMLSVGAEKPLNVRESRTLSVRRDRRT